MPPREIDIRTNIRPTVAEIDLGALRRNFARFRSEIGSGPAVYAVVKADAYGHGAVPVARALAPLADALAVSLVEEGLELREAGLRGPIVVLGAYYNRHHDEVLRAGLLPVVYDPADLERFAAAASRAVAKPSGPRPVDTAVGAPGRARVHVKVDTGMSRLGVGIDELPATLDLAMRFPSLELAGLATHLASADAPSPDDTREQLTRFARCLDVARTRGLSHLTTHAANSAASVRFPEARMGAVRPGLYLYGAMPSPTVAEPELEPALRLTTRVMALHHIAIGAGVSYGGTWRASRPSTIATLPIGYADGYPRHVRGAEVIVRGRRAPIVGVVCMDMLMIDVTDVPGTEHNDPVTLLGSDPAGTAATITVDELARVAGTINYEILCGISKRVPRIYAGVDGA